jgi:hypothetical protein
MIEVIVLKPRTKKPHREGLRPKLLNKEAQPGLEH